MLTQTGQRAAAGKHVAGCRGLWTGTTGDQLSQLLHPFAVDIKVGITQPCGRTHGDELLLRAQMQFQVIDKTEYCAAAFGMEIIPGLRDDAGAWQRLHCLDDTRPSRVGWLRERQRCDPLGRRGGVTADAIGFVGAGRELALMNSQVLWWLTCAGEQRHEQTHGQNDGTHTGNLRCLAGRVKLKPVPALPIAADTK